MIEGGGLGKVDADEIGPIEMQARNGVVDVVVADEAEATAVTKRLLGLLPGHDAGRRRARPGAAARARARARAPRLRGAADRRDARRRGLGDLPARALRAGDGHRAGADRGPAARRDRQRHPAHGRRDHQRRRPTRRRASCSSATPSACRSSRSSTRPGSWSGRRPRRTGLVRHASRLLVAGAALRVPLVAVVLRRGYGLGAQAMVGGSLHEPLLTVAWPTRPPRPDGPRGRGPARPAQGARGDRRRGRARAARARPDRGGRARTRRRSTPRRCSSSTT